MTIDTRFRTRPATRTALAAVALAGAVGLGALAVPALAHDGARGGHGMMMGGPGMMMGGAGGGAQRMLEMFDRDGDGEVTAAEIEAVRADRFAGADADGDGTLGLEEFQAIWNEMTRRHMVDAWQHLDQDGSAGVTAEEFAAPIDRMTRMLDADGDGTITEDEVGGLRQRFHDRRGDGPRGDRPGRGD